MEEKIHQLYFKEISKSDYDPIDDSKIKNHLKIAQDGYDYEKKEWKNQKAIDSREVIIKANMRLIPSIVSKMIGIKHTLYMDCISECHFAIIKCIIKFDLTQKVAFATYAQVAIKRFVWKYLREHVASVKLPSFQLKKRKEEEDRMYQSEGILDHLYKKDYVPVNHVCSIHYEANTNNGSVYNPLQEIECQSPNAIQNLLYEERKEKALDALKCLNNKERKVIEARILFDERKVTLNCVANELNITGERVRQIEKNALEKMRSHMEINELGD